MDQTRRPFWLDIGHFANGVGHCVVGKCARACGEMGDGVEQEMRAHSGFILLGHMAVKVALVADKVLNHHSLTHMATPEVLLVTCGLRWR